jgi:hypothetical protein
VLSENVLEFTVDSAGATTGLNPNQIRFRIVLERLGTGATARARRVVETTIAMRSITNTQTN